MERTDCLRTWTKGTKRIHFVRGRGLNQRKSRCSRCVGATGNADKIFAKIEKVTREDIQRLANEIFIPERLNLTAIGSFPKAGYFDPLAC